MHECTGNESINTLHNPLHSCIGKYDGHKPFGSSGFAKQSDAKILEECCSENCFSYFKANDKLTCDSGDVRGALGSRPNKFDRRGSKTQGEMFWLLEGGSC